MVKKYYKDWKNFQESSLEYLSHSFAKSRMTFRYRNGIYIYIFNTKFVIRHRFEENRFFHFDFYLIE